MVRDSSDPSISGSSSIERCYPFRSCEMPKVPKMPKMSKVPKMPKMSKVPKMPKMN